MAINITFNTNINKVTPAEMQEGKAYIDGDGTIYVCIMHCSANIVAFSLCGRWILFRDFPGSFSEVTLDIVVHST